MRCTVDDLLGAARARLSACRPEKPWRRRAPERYSSMFAETTRYDSTAASPAPSASRATYLNGVRTRRAPRAIRASQTSMP